MVAAFLPEVLGLGVRWALQVLCPQPAGGEDSGEVTVTSTRFHWQECTPGRGQPPASPGPRQEHV